VVAQPAIDSVATSHAVLKILAVCMIIVRFSVESYGSI
jgi:hypothetical protein